MQTGSFCRRLVMALSGLAAMLANGHAAEPAADAPPRYVSPLTASKFDPAELSWPLVFSRVDSDFSLSPYSTKLHAARIVCQWRNPANRSEFHGMSLWKGKRPDLSQSSDPESLESVWNRMSADIAVDQCPATWGEALILVWGPTAPQLAQAKAKEYQKRQAELKASGETEEQRSAREATQAWQAEALALPALSPAQERELVEQIETELSSMEANIDKLNSKPVDTALQGALGDRIVRLAQIAFAKSRGLSADGANRAAFDAWDNRLGGPALMATLRIDKIIYSRANRRFRLAEIPNANDAIREMDSWNNVRVKRFWEGRTFLLSFIYQKLAGKALVDPAFLKKIASDLERERPNGDPGLPYYRYQPAEQKPSWMMTPYEQEAQDKGRMMEGAVAAVMAVGDMIRLIEKIDADVRNSRKAFWQCYATRCKEAGKAFYAYSTALNNKDQWLIFRPAISPHLMAPGMAMLGARNVDGGIIDGCGAELKVLGQALEPAGRMRESDPAGAARIVLATLKSPAYAAWQGCRDRMEYILRPRFP